MQQKFSMTTFKSTLIKAMIYIGFAEFQTCIEDSQDKKERSRVRGWIREESLRQIPFRFRSKVE
jgi:hypothetical protein